MTSKNSNNKNTIPYSFMSPTNSHTGSMSLVGANIPRDQAEKLNKMTGGSIMPPGNNPLMLQYQRDRGNFSRMEMSRQHMLHSGFDFNDGRNFWPWSVPKEKRRFSYKL
ncbi:hypothetical protein JCM33374_g3124 [Metschnikowia sp. JCM 33374]|nr:hypothetical protein JCM33374_g3124 [Metschnikowia sp. JCM 33374]